MKTRPSLAVRLLTIVSAIILLVGYVMYAQVQVQRKIAVAPGSKFATLEPPLSQKKSTNEVPKGKPVPVQRLTVFPGSKSLAPVLSVPATTETSRPAPPKVPRLAPGSKSAEVFSFRPEPATEVKRTNAARTSVTVTNASAKRSSL